MSAFDIAGAVVWTPLAVLGWRMVFVDWTDIDGVSTETMRTTIIGTIILSLAAVYCIARLHGATT